MKSTHNILIESDWLRDYYFVMKVMNGNLEKGTVDHEITTFKWGMEVLGMKRKHILSRYFRYSDTYGELLSEFSEYLEALIDLHHSIMEKLSK